MPESDSRNMAPDSKPDSDSRNAVLDSKPDLDSDLRNMVLDSTTDVDSTPDLDSLTPRSPNYSLKPTTGIRFAQRCWLC